MEIQTITEIVAPAGVIWDILVDFEHYPEWNPFTYHVEGVPQLGTQVRLNVRFSDGSEVVTRHLI